MRSVRVIAAILTACLVLSLTLSATQVRLQFSGHLTTGGGSCQRVSQDRLRCLVEAGSTTTLTLTAAVTPPQNSVSIGGVGAPPSWVAFHPVSGYGTVETQAVLRPPAAAAGQSVVLTFRATTVYGLHVDLVVELVIQRAAGGDDGERPGERYSGTTDEEGEFEVPLGDAGAVSGRLTECGQRALPDQPFTVVQTDEGFTFGAAGYLDALVTEYSSLTIPFLNVTVYDVGSVCMRPAGTPDLRFYAEEEVRVVVTGIGEASCRCLEADSQRIASCELQKCRVLLSDSNASPGRFYIGNPVDPDRNPGNVRVSSLPKVRFWLQGKSRQVVDLRVTEIEQLTEAQREDWIQLWRVVGEATVDFDPRELPHFEVAIDPENDVAESDEENNALCRDCFPADSLSDDEHYEIVATGGVLEPDPLVPSERWVVGKGRLLEVTAERQDGPAALRLDASFECTESGDGNRDWRTVPVSDERCPACICHEWDFDGDGEVDETGVDARHTYDENGVYALTLRTHLGGVTLVATQIVEVTDRPTVTLLPPRFGDVFVSGIRVINTFQARVHENGNTVERVVFSLNEATVTCPPAEAVASFDMAGLDPHPQTNRLVVVAHGLDSDGNPVSSDPATAARLVPAAPIPGWLGWIISLSGGISVDTSRPPLVKYGTSFTFPEPPIETSFEVPSYVPLLDGEYEVKAKAELGLSVSSKGTAEVEAKGDAAFEKKGGDWTFGIKGEMSVKGVTSIGPPIRLTQGAFSASVEGSVSKDFDVSDAFPAVKAATKIPVIGRGIEYLAERATIGVGFSAGVAGEASFESVDRGAGSCIEGFDCSGALTLSGGISLSLTVDLSIVSASAYGNANLIAKFTAPGEELGFLDFDSLNLDGSFGIVLTADLWLVEVTKDFSIPFHVQIASPEEGFAEPEETDWAIVERPYVGPVYDLYRGEITEDSELATRQLLVVSDAFPLARPALAVTATDRWLLWTTDDDQKPFPRGREIRASTGPGIDRMSPPQSVTDNELPDSQSVVGVTADGATIAVWVRHTSPPTELRGIDDLTSQILAGLEIVYSIYDPTTGRWKPAERLTDNDVMDHSPRLVFGDRGVTGVAWIRNTAGELFPAPDGSSPDALHYAYWDGAAFRSVGELTSELSGTQHAMAETDGSFVLVWVEDVDGDWATAGDNEVFAATWRDGSWSDAERLTENDVDDVRPALTASPSGGVALLWIREGDGASNEESALVSRTFTGRVWTSEVALMQAPHLVTAAMSSDDSGRIAVVWEGFEGSNPDLFAAVCDPEAGTCTEPRQLTADRAAEGQLAVGFDRGLLTVAFVRERLEQRTEPVEHDDVSFDIERLVPEGHDVIMLETEMP